MKKIIVAALLVLMSLGNIGYAQAVVMEPNGPLYGAQETHYKEHGHDRHRHHHRHKHYEHHDNDAEDIVKGIIIYGVVKEILD